MPPTIWRHIIGAVGSASRIVVFWHGRPALTGATIAALAASASTPRSPRLPGGTAAPAGLSKNTNCCAASAPVIACPEAPFGPRLARRFESVPRAARSTGTVCAARPRPAMGIMVPMGFEFASSDDMDARAGGTPAISRAANGRISIFAAEIREANALSEQLAPSVSGELRMLTDPEQPVTALLRSRRSRCSHGARRA